MAENLAKHKICALLITQNVGPRLHATNANMDSCFLPMHCPFFLALQRGIEPYFDTDGFPAQLLAQHRKILTAR